MYQILSLKEHKEYFVTEEDYCVENYTINDFSADREFWHSKPLFQTMLDYINTDYNSEALDNFLQLVSKCSNNCMLDGVISNTLDYSTNPFHSANYYQYDIRTLTQNERNIFFYEFLYTLFPNDKKKKHISAIKGHRKKGMMINKQFEKEGIAQYKKSLESKNENKLKRLSMLREYFNKMNTEKSLLNPDVFALYIRYFADMQEQVNSSDIGIGCIMPLITTPTNQQTHVDFDINAFVSAVNNAYKDSMYDEYLIIARGVSLHDGGHDENPFAHDFYGINEFNIVVSNIYFVLQRGWSINKCANCGKYFISYNRSDTKYCQNPAPLDTTKTCQEYASTRGYYINRQSNELEKLRGKVKGRLSKRAQREADFGQQYDMFRKYDKEWRSIVKDNDKKYNDYFLWLKNVDDITKASSGAVEKAEPKPL